MYLNSGCIKLPQHIMFVFLDYDNQKCIKVFMFLIIKTHRSIHVYNYTQKLHISKYVPEPSVFSPPIWDWRQEPFQLEKLATKQEIWENSFLMIMMKFNDFYNLSKY